MMGIENQIFEEEYGKVADELRAAEARADELAAEVARRKTDAGAFQRMYAELYERACDLEEDNAALRAQLAAVGGVAAGE